VKLRYRTEIEKSFIKIKITVSDGGLRCGRREWAHYASAITAATNPILNHHYTTNY